MSDDIKISSLELGPYATNAYIILSLATGDSVLVDAPDEPDLLIAQLEGTTPRFIMITHSHFDHTGALKDLKAKLKIPVAAHPLDAPHLPIKPDVLLNDGDYVKFGNEEIQVIHTPGHTPGSICLKIGNALISGDTIFPGGPGHTDSPHAFKQIIDSLTSRIFVLPGDTDIFPGHGPGTTLAIEKQNFAVFNSRPHSIDLFGDVLWLSST
jgi:hydroxyacylglutathione hydrolase